MSSDLIYLDYNASTPVRPQVNEIVQRTLALGGNPSSVHRFGRLARGVVDKARDAVATLVSTDPSSIIFTSGGTEANAVGIHSLVANGVERLIILATEHDSVLAAAYNSGVKVVELPVLSSGCVDLEILEKVLSDGSRAGVAIHLANNETGVIQPIREVANYVHAKGGFLHCDAAQGLGRIEVDLKQLGADTFSFSAHKIGGPQGVGAIIANNYSLLSPLQLGGGQERGLRAGTENVPGIAGFGRAAELALEDLNNAQSLQSLRDHLESSLLASFSNLSIIGKDSERLPNTTCFAFSNLTSETQVIALDLSGIAVSAGAACSSGKVGPSHVLKAMGISEGYAKSAIRISLGWATKRTDIDRFISAWSEIVSRQSFNTEQSIAL